MTVLDPLVADLRDRRIAADLSQTALAMAIGCSASWVSELESGRRGNPTLATLRKLGQALGVQPGWVDLAYETAPAATHVAAGNGAPEGGLKSPPDAPASDPVAGSGGRADVARCENCGHPVEKARTTTGYTHVGSWLGVRCQGEITGAVARTLDVAERTVEKAREARR